MKKCTLLKINLLFLMFLILVLNNDNVYGATVSSFEELRDQLTSAGDINIYLNADIPVKDTINCSNSGTKTIYGQGHTIWNYLDVGGNVKPGDASNTCIDVPNGATIHLNNVYFNGRYVSGMITNTNSSTNIVVRGTCYVENNCAFANGCQGIHVYTTGRLYFKSGDVSVNNDYGIGNLGTLNIEGGTISGTAQGIHNNGGTVNISGGKIKKTSYNNIGVINFNNGTINITSVNANITGWARGIDNTQGTLNVTANASIYDNSEEGIYNSSTANIKAGLIHDNDRNGIQNNSGATATISGGTIYNNLRGINNLGTLVVSGGTIRNNTDSQSGGIYHNGTSCTITGGTFGTNPIQNVYLAADDKYVTTNTSKPTFRVYPNTYTRGRKVVQTSSTSYPTQLIDSYVTLYPSTGWYLRAVGSEIDLWDKGTVTATYKTSGGTELQDSTSSTGWVNDSYTTSAPSSIGLYDLKTTPSNATGKYSSTAITVNYIYEQARGKITVKYINKYTNKTVKTQVTSTGTIGKSYRATAPSISGYVLDGTTSSITKSYTTNSQTITFYYVKESTVTTKYVDISHSNSEIIPNIVNTLKHGDSYTSEEKEFDGYTLVKSPTNKEGTVGESNITVTYEYRKNSPGIEVKYIDKYTGEEIADKVEVDGLVGETYTPVPKTIENYQVVKSPSAITFGDDKVTLTYEYALVSKLTVSYIDLTNSNNKLTNDDVIKLKQGDTYTTAPKTIDGYTLVEEPEDRAVTMGREDIEVVYGYKKNSPGVEVKYIDKYEGTEIATKVIKTGVIGEEFTSEVKTIDGYIIETKPENETVIMSEEKITLIYEYVKGSTLTVQYIDLTYSNAKLTDDIVVDLKQNETYETEAKAFENYTLVEQPDNPVITAGRENITITYGYKKNSPGVEVKYVDKYTREEIYETIIKTGVVGEEFEVEEKEKEGYEIVSKPEDKKVIMTEEKITITYEYALVSNLTVSYIDLTHDNVKLTDDDVIKLKQGDTYTTAPKTIDGYTLVEEPEDRTVTMGREDIEVVYGYKKNSPGVEVKYIDKYEGTEIATKVTKTGVVGEEFTAEEKTIEGYIIETKPENETVIMGEDKITLVYEYVKGSTLTVQYIDLTYSNAKLTDDVVVKLKQNETYETEAKAFENYTLVEQPDNPTVTMQRSNITITYGYKKNSPGVEVKYIDKYTGEEIAEKVVKTGLVGDSFTASSLDIEKYELVKRPENETITFGEEKITLTYEYALVSKLTVSYIDLTHDNAKLAEDIVVNLKQGDTYTTEQKTFNGYTLVEEPEYKVVTMEREDVNIIYAYKKNSPGVEVRYIDKYTGAELAEKVVKTGLVGDVFTAEEKQIEGYGIVTRPENETITFGEEKIILIYEYADEFNLIIKYKDIVNNEYITEDDVIVYKQGDSYKAEPKEIDGYRLVSYPENQEGIFNGSDIEVEFGYKKISGGVEIKFIDQVTGEEISEPIIKEGLEEDNYITTPKNIEGYELVKTPENPKGEMTVEKITVIYEYRKISYVTVNYIDENNGRILYGQSNTKYLEGDEYITNQEQVSGYTFTRVEGNAKGIVGNKDIEVTYYYKKNTFVTIKYIDMVTNDVLQEEVINGLENDEYETKDKEIQGYAFIEVDGIPNGKMPSEPREVIYKYKKQSNLITEHIDANTGEKITEDVIKTYKQGDTYEALAQNIEGYVVVEEPDQKTGIVEREDIKKTFKYKKISGGLVVKYVDKITEELLDYKEYEGNEKDNITLEEKTFLGYVLEERPNITNVILGVEPQEVIYYYRKAVDIIVKGIDQNTGEEIYNTKVSGIEGDIYTTTPRSIQGYELVKIPENTTGIFDRENKTVIYEYRKIAGEVNVRYINKETGEEFGSYKITGKIGDNYKAERKEIEKYEIVEVEGNEIGILGEETKEVVYYYERKIGKVKVIYEDEEGNEILKEEIKGKVDDEYKVEIKEVEGYKIIEIPENTEGKYEEEEIEIRIKLEKDSEVKPIEEDKIIVKFIDKEGNVIKEEYLENGEEGKSFYYKLPEIEGYKIVGEKVIKAKFIKGELVFEAVYEKILEEIPNTGDMNLIILLIINVFCSIFIIKFKKLNMYN